MSRFQMPTEPKNGLDLLRWFIFEPMLLEKFSDNLSKEKTLYWLLKAYQSIILLASILYIIRLAITVSFDIPSHFPLFYESQFIIQWKHYSSYTSHFVLLFSESIKNCIFSLVIGIVGGLVSTTLVPGLIVGLAFEIFFGLTGGLGSGIIAGIVVGETLFVIFKIHGGNFNKILGSLFIYGIVFTSAIGFFVFNSELKTSGLLGFGIIGTLSIICFFCIAYFRLPFYLFYLFYSISANNLKKNPYLIDGIISLPLYPLDEKLVKLAYEQPEIGLDFATFLLEFRPLQKQLAAKILHARNAGKWLQQATTLNADVFDALFFSDNWKGYNHSENWLATLEQLQKQLIVSQKHNQIGLKKATFEEFLKLLKEFRIQILSEPRTWNRFYLYAIDSWLKVSTEHLEMLKQKAELLEPITSNIYKANDALHIEFDQIVFVGRDDLKETLSFELLTAGQMPLFLIQGQRRVGKTSLLNFLPLLLGPRFKIVPLDLQGLENQTVRGFLFALRNTINKAFDIREETVWNPLDDWLRAWGEFREYVEQLTNGKDFKLVLAFDEYEILHDDIFQRDPQQAARLLGAMRSFSQSQNQVVFLFVGARFFSDLQQPNWNEYFVQVKHLRVDYLKRPDVLHLIQRPTPDFGLVYADDLANRIFDLTQGHPALVQQICSEMVNLANMTNHRYMTHEDLNHVLAEKTLFRENLTIQIFWTQFCAPAERATVKQILAGETPTDPVSRYRLELHGYIVKDGDVWNMRVPLFEQWLRKYIETFPI